MNFFGVLRVGVLTAMLLRNCLALISATGILSVPSKLAMPSKFSSRIPWREKLTRQQEAKIVAIPPRMQARFGKGKMVIPKPLDVDALIRRVPRGKIATVLQLREEWARRSNVDVACPLCTGIFVRISAEAAEEERRAGKKSVTPYWRVISREGRLNPKFPGGVAGQRRKLASEGHKILRATGKKALAVANFQSALVRFQPPD
jgi:hypothetical protein